MNFFPLPFHFFKKSTFFLLKIFCFFSAIMWIFFIPHVVPQLFFLSHTIEAFYGVLNNQRESNQWIWHVKTTKTACREHTKKSNIAQCEVILYFSRGKKCAVSINICFCIYSLEVHWMRWKWDCLKINKLELTEIVFCYLKFNFKNP